jgi:RNA polymerase sigma factor (sigma-70 family)
MADRLRTTVFHHLSRRATADSPDKELLDRFLSGRDEAAFAALVARHGGMVLGACRRLLGNAQDAEDACQTVFVVLARKAGSIRRREALPGWLHGVACRVCRKLQGRLARRRPCPAPAAVAPDVTAEVTWREVCRVLDEELNRLPAGYRAALVLCYLEGKTQDKAAHELGRSLGTLHGRVERGREMLLKRLTRRGVTLSGALLGAVPTQHAGTAGQPQAVLPNAAPPHILSLAGGMIRTMSLRKDGWIAVVGLTVALFAAAVVIMKRAIMVLLLGIARLSAGPCCRANVVACRPGIRRSQASSKDGRVRTTTARTGTPPPRAGVRLE